MAVRRRVSQQLLVPTTSRSGDVRRKAIVVSGATGCGKTTLVRDVDLRKHVAESIRFSEVMERERIRSPELRGRSLGELFPAERSKCQERAMVAIASDATRPAVIDGHLIVRSPNGGFVSGLPRDALDMLEVVGFVVVWAPVRQMLRRKPDDSPQAIQRRLAHAEATRLAAMTYALASGGKAAVDMIGNPDGAMDEALLQLSAFVTGHLPTKG